jgi:hypothetical protein
MSPITGRLDLTAWRNDDWYEYPLRVRGIDITGIALVMEVRRTGDTSGPALIALAKVIDGQNGATFETQGIHLRSVTIVDGVAISDVRIRMDRATLRAMPYYGELGQAADFEYAFLIGGRTRLVGKFVLPAHAYGSDNADEDRPESTGFVSQSGVPDAGATLSISQDGGATVSIDGADLVSITAEEARAAADNANQALAGIQAIATTSYRAVAGYAEREAIPLAQRGNGMRVLVVGQREFEWSTSMAGPGAWTGLLTEEELTRRQLQHGTQGQDTIDGLPATLAAQAAAIGRIDRDIAYKDTAITAFTVAPAIAEIGTTVNAVTFHLEETGSGPFAKVITRGDGQTVWWLKSASRDAIGFADATISTDLLTVGDSLLYDIGPTAANAAGLNLANPTSALYSQTIRKQALRIGIFPIAVTLAGGTLPASGATGTVTTVNGQPTTFANPDAFLHASGVDTDTHAMTGTLVGRQVTITYNPNTLDTYTITQANGAAVAVPAGSIFVPDFAAMMSAREVWLLPGHNSMSLSSPAASFEEIRTTIDAMMAKRGTNRTLLMIYWLAEVELSLLPYLNDLRAYLRKAYPANYVVDAQGRDTYDMLLANSSEADRARGLVSATLRRDDIHPNATGIGLIKDQIVYFRNSRMAATMALKVTTDFTLSVNGKARTASVRFFPRRFWGVSASDALTNAQIVALAGSELSDSRSKAFTANAAGQYVFYAYLASLADPGGFKIGGFNEQYVKAVVSVTTAAGLTADYIVLRSLNKLTGAVSVEVQ